MQYTLAVPDWSKGICTESSEEDMVQAIEYVHIHRRKIYMTVNTLLKDREMEELYAYLLPYYRAGLDGVIVQDIGVVSISESIFQRCRYMQVHR